MPTKYIVHNISRSNLGIDITNVLTGYTQHIVLQPGLDVDLVPYAGTMESCDMCLDVYKYKRSNLVAIYKR